MPARHLRKTRWSLTAVYAAALLSSGGMPAGADNNQGTSQIAPGAQPSATTHQRKFNNEEGRNLWTLGLKLSEAAMLSRQHEVKTERVNVEWEAAAKIATAYGLPLLPLPDRIKGADGNIATSCRYCGNTTDPALPFGKALSSRFGPDGAVLYEIAVQTHLLRYIYTADDSFGPQISKALQPKVARVLPEKIWKPLFDAIARNAPVNEVKQRLDEFDAAVFAFFR